MSFFQELKKRQVVRIAAMYLVAAWILLQFGQVMIELMQLPDWLGRALVVLLALGFPFVLILVWVFDMTRQGFVRSGATEVSDLERLRANRKIDIALLVLLILGVIFALYLYQSDELSTVGQATNKQVTTQVEARSILPGKYLLIGNLVDFTGSSGLSGRDYGQAIIDSVNWINENGGIQNSFIDLDTIETSYIVRRALTSYKKWKVQGVLAIQGWGTHIGQALQKQVSEDQVPYFSASYAAAFTDPKGLSNRADAAPYNFFYGPSYSDGCRGLLQWAKEDWMEKQGIGSPTYIHMGDNQPYPNAPKAACEDYAGELGFEVLPAITFSLIPGNYSRQCRQLASINPDYVFLANLDKSVSALLTQCRGIGLELQYMVNIWGFDETVMQTAGLAANNVVWVMGAASWQDTVPGIYLVREISKMSDPEQEKYRSVHYLRGVCSMFYLKEAIENAMEIDVLTGRSIKSAMYEATDWVPDGLEGVCLSATWREDDHRGINRVLIYRSTVAGPVGNLSIKELIENRTIQMNQVYVAEIPRRKEWLGY